MTTLCLTTTTLPLADEALPAPVCVATINCDPRLLGPLNPTRLLSQLAHKLGLLHFAIVDGEEQNVPGFQLDLFH
jgi:hypothetical protein